MVQIVLGRRVFQHRAADARQAPVLGHGGVQVDIGHAGQFTDQQLGDARLAAGQIIFMRGGDHFHDQRVQKLRHPEHPAFGRQRAADLHVEIQRAQGERPPIAHLVHGMGRYPECGARRHHPGAVIGDRGHHPGQRVFDLPARVIVMAADIAGGELRRHADHRPVDRLQALGRRPRGQMADDPGDIGFGRRQLRRRVESRRSGMSEHMAHPRR